MSKITFRADDELVERLEAFDASKSEVMRDALRSYLDSAARETTPTASDTGSIGSLIEEQIDRVVADRVESELDQRASQTGGETDVSVSISLEGTGENATVTEQSVSRQTQSAAEEQPVSRKTQSAETQPAASDDDHTCSECGASISADHVYCPNCGAKSSHKTVCECGEELQPDWSFCPECGRRTPAADVLDPQ